jgi:hypothetical protein
MQEPLSDRPTASPDGTHTPAPGERLLLRTRRFDELLRWYRTVFGPGAELGRPVSSFMSLEQPARCFSIVRLEEAGTAPGADAEPPEARPPERPR